MHRIFRYFLLLIKMNLLIKYTIASNYVMQSNLKLVSLSAGLANYCGVHMSGIYKLHLSNESTIIRDK